MKDEHDKHTAELIPMPKRFDARNSVPDRKTEYAPKPNEGRQAYSNGIHSIYFVPVAFAAIPRAAFVHCWRMGA